LLAVFINNFLGIFDSRSPQRSLSRVPRAVRGWPIGVSVA
jgi:hypothetical protein